VESSTRRRRTHLRIRPELEPSRAEMALAPKRVDRGGVVVAHFTLLGVVPHPSADMVLETVSAAGQRGSKWVEVGRRSKWVQVGPSGSEGVRVGQSGSDFEALVWTLDHRN
jgi:hypothetical protein